MNDSTTWGIDPNEGGSSTQPPSGEENLDTTTGSEGEAGAEPSGGSPSKKSAEARINDLIAENKRLIDEMKAGKKDTTLLPPPAPTPDAKEAALIEGLKKLGFARVEDLEKTKTEVRDEMVLNTEHSRLVDVYSGSDGRPKYDRNEVEKYMRENGIYLPEVAYKAMHETELNDWLLKNASHKNKPYTAPPSAPTKGEEGAITREKIAEMQKSPNFKQWYEANREKILKLMVQGSL